MYAVAKTQVPSNAIRRDGRHDLLPKTLSSPEPAYTFAPPALRLKSRWARTLLASWIKMCAPSHYGSTTAL